MTGESRPEGWHQDPDVPGRERWWDGVGWTAFERDVTPPASTPVMSSMRGLVRPEEARVLHVREWTPQVLWIAVSPVWVAFISYALTGFGIASAFAGVLAGFFPLVAVAALGVLAFGDRDELRRRGCRNAASPFWMLLTPLCYLTLRGFALRPYGAHGFGWVLLMVGQLVVIGVVVWYWIALQGLTTVPTGAWPA